MRYLLGLAGLLALSSSLAAQEPSQTAKGAQAGTPTIRATVQEVVLDMVFRDKKGKAVRDIRPEEVHVFEEGTEQKLDSFRLVEGKTARVMAVPASGSAAPASVVPLDPLREIRLVSLVFEGLDNEDKRFFRQAVKDMLEMAPEPNLYFSILAIDQKLHCLQPFTSDHQALLESLGRMQKWSFVQFLTQSADVEQSLSKVVSSDVPQLTGSSAGGPSAGQIGDMVNWRLAKMQYDMLRAGDATDREFEARATVSGLWNLVRAQSTLPGRKMILYFNPHLRIPESVDEQYKNLKSLANRGNVSFYTVDTKGLISDYSANTRAGSASERAAGRDMLRDSADASRNTTMGIGDRKVTEWQAKAGETAVSAIRDNPQGWLRDLAKDTGGAMIGDSNDWKAPLRVAMEEVRTYYEASYTPQITTYDGKFRKISVRVGRPDLQVRSRSGYYALPVLGGGQQLYAYELPLLNALAANPAPGEVNFRAAAQRFSDRGPKLEYMLTVEAPMQGLVFDPSPATKVAKVSAGLLMVLKDERGEIVDKFSKDFAVQVDLDKLDAYKAGNLVQTFRTSLAPGPHTLEVAVMDRQGNKIGVKRIKIAVPNPSAKLSISEIVIVGRTHALKDSQILDAFYFEGGKIVPTLTDSLKGGPGSFLPFYFAVYPDPSIQAAPKLTMSFFKDGAFLGSAEAPLPPQKDGRIPYIANIPADKFPPGNYEIRVGVAQGDSKAEEKIAFRIE